MTHTLNTLHTGLGGGGLFGQTSQQATLGGLGTVASSAGGLFSQPQAQVGGGLFSGTNTLGGGLGNTGERLHTQSTKHYNCSKYVCFSYYYLYTYTKHYNCSKYVCFLAITLL